MKLAPFKFPFTKMSKSRSSDDKEKNKERDAEKDKERENQNEDTEPEDNAEGDNVQRLTMDQLQLTTDANCDLKSPASDGNSLMVRKETPIPSSPPPSYEHVIETTMFEHAVAAQKQGNSEMEKQMTWTERNSGGSAPRGDQRTPARGPKILHKSSKEFYRAMAKQWGITCKMSDHCRCLDCQSRYFDCEYEKSEHQKTDGGLGAGTPMFISEAMESSGCFLL